MQALGARRQIDYVKSVVVALFWEKQVDSVNFVRIGMFLQQNLVNGKVFAIK
jgi:hypothetical protein